MHAAADARARVGEVLEECPALRAVLGVPLDLERRDRVHFAIEICLDAQRFSALHLAPLRLP
jgi:hypothetical protein